MFVSLQLMLERKSKEVGKLVEETEKSIRELSENISQAKVNEACLLRGNSGRGDGEMQPIHSR